MAPQLNEDECVEPLWRRGSLHGGQLDIDATLWTHARRQVPLDALKAKLQEYVDAGYIPMEKQAHYAEVFEHMQNCIRQQNVFADPNVASVQSTEQENTDMTDEELDAELQRREKLMKTLDGKEDCWTDQWRVYKEVVEQLQINGDPLRYFLQASAGTGKSFLLETLYLWCLRNGFHPEACAPTGIAAARIRVPRTPIDAFTLHHIFALNLELESQIDVSKPPDERTQRLQKTTVLFIDEASMVDDATWWAIKDQLTTVAETPIQEDAKKPHPRKDSFGRIHLFLACDFKQLPPATSRPPFIAADCEVCMNFDFRVLRQNRRLTRSTDPTKQLELENFHTTLEDIATGRASPAVRKFFVEAYVRGARANQHSVGFEESTACFPTRRTRDRWNRKILERSAKEHKRTLRVKGVFAVKGTEAQWIRDQAATEIRRSLRSQCLPTAGKSPDWAQS